MGTNIGVLASGEGTLFESLVLHKKFGVFENIDRIVLVYTPHPKIQTEDPESLPVARRAEIHEVERRFIRYQGRSREEAELDLVAFFEANDVKFGVSAGYAYILDKQYLRRFPLSLNTHPSLLPSYGGKGMYGDKVHRAVLEDSVHRGLKFSGCTVHIMGASVDKGPIVLQRKVDIDDEIVKRFQTDQDEGIAMLREKVKGVEQELLPQAIQVLVDGRVELTVTKRTTDGLIDGGYTTVRGYEEWLKGWDERQSRVIDEIRKRIRFTSSSLSLSL